MTVPAPGVPPSEGPTSGVSASGLPTPAPVPPVMPYPPVPGPPSAAAPPVMPYPPAVPGPPPAPGPPAGPGVAPPFAAPPVEGRTFRMWLALGVAALAVVLCCGGGAVAVVGLVVAGSEAVNEQARAVVGDYLDAVREEEYDQAYQLLCAEARLRESPAEFEERVSAGPDITDYQVGEVVIVGEITVPVEVTYASGQQDNLQASLAQDSGTGEFRVCDIG